MPTLHLPILIVLLLIPNTTWRDWHATRGAQPTTPLQIQIANLMEAPNSSCAIAVMNDRTAETDKITTLAGARTLLAGARLKSTQQQSASATNLGYAALPGNLPQSLARDGIAPEAGDPESSSLIDSMSIRLPERGKFVVATLSADAQAEISQIKFWRERVTPAGKCGELILVSPNPSPVEYQAHDQLTPILFWQSDSVASKPKLLYSPSTRTQGLIANTDVAATIASLARVQPIGPSFGSACMPQDAPSHTNAADVLAEIGKNATLQARNQQSVPFLAAVLATVIAAASFLIWAKKLARIGYAAVYAIAPVPLTLLYARTWQDALVAVVIIAAAGAALVVVIRSLGSSPVVSAIPGFLRNWLVPLYAAAALALIAGDTLFNQAHGTADSLLGYSPLEGARYYGLGNEAMGVLTGAVAILSSRIALSIKPGENAPDRRAIVRGAILWIAAAALLAMPELGAKAGAIPVTFVGLFSYLAMTRKAASTASSSTPKHSETDSSRIWTTLAVAALALTFLAYSRIMHPHSAATHVSIGIEQAQRFGPSVYSQIIFRKLVMDAHLTIHSVWMLVLIAATAGTLINLGKSVPHNAQRAGMGAKIGALTTLACLLFNDAGVVAAALCGCLIWSDLLTARSEILQNSAQI